MTTEMLQATPEVLIRQQIAELIKAEKDRATILKELKIKNGDLTFHLRHLAHESKCSSTSIDGLLRHFRRQEKRLQKH